jgi:hypothetical protein
VASSPAGRGERRGRGDEQIVLSPYA